MGIKVSAVMPSLNVAPYIRECMDSALAQTLREMEFICLDAGSSDGTWEILEEYAEKDSRVRLVRSDKKSYGHQVNQGFDMARGEYVAILETDDFVRRDMYERLAAAADAAGADFAKSDYFFTRPHCSGGYSHELGVALFLDSDDYGRALSGEEMIPYCLVDHIVWNGVYRKSFLDKFHIRLQETAGAAFQDVGFAAQVKARAERAIYLDENFYCYRVNRPDSSTVNPRCLEFARQECAYILEGGLLEGAEPRRREAVVARLIRFFWDQFTRAAERHGFDPGAASIVENCRWFEERFLPLVEAERVPPGVFDPALWRRIKLALADRAASIREIKAERELFERRCGILRGRPFVICGAGPWGIGIFNRVIKEDLVAAAIADNDCGKWQLFTHGVKVLPPAACVRRYPGAFFVISNRGSHRRAVIGQLLSLDVKREDILVMEAAEGNPGWSLERIV